jgi:uncharacterized tellurite resistance protein B-like protein
MSRIEIGPNLALAAGVPVHDIVDLSFPTGAMPLISRLLARLTHAVGAREEGSSPELDEQLAVAALLVHVARVDGSLGPLEQDRLVRLFKDRFGLAEARAERLIERAKNLDDATSDVADLVEAVATGTDPGERRRILRMAFAVAMADGRLHEFEDDLVWRVGHLLGCAESEITVERRLALDPELAAPREGR